MFFSTPHLGTSVARLNSPTKFLFFPSTEVCDLEEDSPQLIDLNQNFVQLAKDRGNDLKVVSFGESLPTPMFGIDVNFVEQKSANLGIGEHFQINTNHINVCKPDSKDSIIYRKFLDLIMDVVVDNSISGPSEQGGHRDNVPVLFEDLFSKSRKMSKYFLTL